MLEKQLPYKYKVYDTIKKEILCGRYVPGSVLNERMLSEEFGISRTPVREAIQMLAQDGWLQIETYKGAIVREFSPRYMLELSKIRSALEVCAVDSAVSNITEEDIKYLADVQKQQCDMCKNFDALEFILLDRKFHTRIYDLSHNQELIHLLQNYYDIFRFLGMQAVLNTDERPETTVQEHQAILDALFDRDTAAATVAMNIHMLKTEENIRSHVTRKSI